MNDEATKEFLLKLNPEMRIKLRKHRKKQLWDNLNTHHCMKLNFFVCMSHHDQYTRRYACTYYVHLIDNQRKDWLTSHGKPAPLDMTQEQIEKYRIAFDAIDDNNNGILEINEIACAFRFIGVDLCAAQIRHELGLRIDDPDYMDFELFAKWCFEHEDSFQKHSKHISSSKTSSRLSTPADRAFHAPQQDVKVEEFELDGSVFHALLLWMPSYHRQKQLGETTKQLQSRKSIETRLDQQEKRSGIKRRGTLASYRLSMTQTAQAELEWKLFLSRGGSELPEYKQHLKRKKVIHESLEARRKTMLEMKRAFQRKSSYIPEFQTETARAQLLRELEINRRSRYVKTRRASDQSCFATI